MPKRLLDRCAPDSIREFRAAARERYHDGLAAEAAGRRTAAVYLWGYAAEMMLKAAYFAVIGFSDTRTIGRADLRAARDRAPSLNVRWPGPTLHAPEAWAELLAATRAAHPGLAYPSRRFAAALIRRVGPLSSLWSEWLRYHKNVARPDEVRRVRAAVEWLMEHAHEL